MYWSPKALDLQARILKRVPLEQPEVMPSQKQLAASICVQFGEHYLAEKEYTKAARSYKDALSHVPTDNKVGSSQLDPAPAGAQGPARLPGQGVRGMGPLVWGAYSRGPQGLPSPTALGARLPPPL